MSQVKRAFLFQLAGLILFIGLIAWTFSRFPVSDYVLAAQQKIGAMEFWGGVFYPLLYAACNVLLLPGGVLAIGSGLFFGLWWGFFLNLIGNVSGAAISFLISRKLGRAWVQKKFFRHRKWSALDEAIGADGWKIIFLSQVHPLFPTSLLNYLYGVTRIRFRTCMLWVALGQAPGLFLYSYLGTLTQLGLRLVRGETHPGAGEYFLWIGGLVVTIVVTIAFARVALRVLARVEQAAVQQEAQESAGESPQELDVVER
jgi:uncharacterized membrane protein YdjX (TVP38/TMEM64 family)